MRRIIKAFEGVRKTDAGYELDFSKDSEGDVMSLSFLNRRRQVQERDGVKYSYYFAYSHKNSDDREVLKYLKMMEGEPRQMQAFVKKAVLGLDRSVGLSGFDAVVYPKSSSKLLSAVSEFAARKAGSAMLIPDAFVKSAKHEMSLDMEALSRVNEKTRKQVESVFQKIQQSSDEFKMKTVFAPHRKFIKRFIKFGRTDSEAANAILGGKVLLIDDYRTTGTTLREMLDQLIALQPREIVVMIVVDVK